MLFAIADLGEGGARTSPKIENFKCFWRDFAWFGQYLNGNSFVRGSAQVYEMLSVILILHPMSGLLLLRRDQHRSQTASNGRVWNTPNCNANALSITLLRPVHHFFSSNIIKKNTFLIA